MSIFDGVVITLAADGLELTNLKKILNTIKSCVAVLPSRPPFVDAADIKVQESKLKEISGEEGAQSCVAAVSSESNFVNGYILRKKHLKEIYDAEMEDINLEHLKEDILHHVQKLTERTLQAHKIPLSFEVDTYYLLSKTYKNFHPQLVTYVENIVFNSSQFKNHPLSDKSIISNCDLKENICPSNPESSLDNQPRYKTVNSKNDLNETHFCETKSKFNVDLVLKKSYLQRLYSLNWAEDININQFQSSIEKDFERLKCKSSDFSAELEQRLSNTNLLRSSNENINSNVELYYCLCKTFKKMNQNLVQFVESKLNEQKMKCIREIGALITSPKVPRKNDNNRKINGSSSESSSHKLSNLYSSNIASVGIALAPTLSKKKQVPTKTPFQKDSDNDKKHPVTKYLYLKQNLLKRLYQATKVSKDFCIETFRHSIEPSFSQLRNSNLSPETTSLLRQIDIFKHPMEGLNNHTVQVYFQFCRHFHYLNPDLVASVSKKVERIEAGLISEDTKNSSLEKNESSEDKTLKNTGCIPAEVLSYYFSDGCKKLNDLEINEAMKKKVMSKISVQTDFVSNLENKIGQKLYVEQSFSGNFFLSYFKLCQTFKDFDLEFISYVKDEVEKMPSLRRNSINTISSEASESNSDMQHTTSVESLPVESDTSSALTESTVTHSYKELSDYPPCESAPICFTKTLNAELKSALCECQQSLMKTAENDEVYFKSESEGIVPTVFNFLKGSKETTLKDVERFSIPANVRAESDSLKQSKNYEELLHSYQTFKVSDSVTSAAKQRPQNDKILDKMTKKEIQSFCDSVEDKAQNRVSFSDTVVSNNEATASNSSTDIMEPTPIGFANLSSQEISLVSGHTSEFNFPGFHESEFNKSYQGHLSSIDTTDQVRASMSNNHQDTKREAKKVSKKSSKKGNENEEDNSSVQAHSYQGSWMSNRKTNQFPASPSRNQEVQKTKKNSKTSSKKGSVDQEDDSSDWVTASSAESGLDEEGPSMPQVLKTTIPKNSAGDFSSHQSEVLNLCDRCKSWYRSTGSFEFSDIADKTRNSPNAKIPKKMQSKKSSKGKHPSGDHDSWDSRVPSYEQLIQWYNMWYQQVIFSQQFVWYNEYLRNMSSED